MSSWKWLSSRGLLKCTGTFWAGSQKKGLTFDPKCTGTFWAVSTGLQLTCLTFDPKCTGTFWAVSTGFDTKCTCTFWTVSPGCLTLDTKCTGTFWAVSTGLWLTCLAFECECSPTHSYDETLVATWWFIVCHAKGSFCSLMSSS